MFGSALLLPGRSFGLATRDDVAKSRELIGKPAEEKPGQTAASPTTTTAATPIASDQPRQVASEPSRSLGTPASAVQLDNAPKLSPVSIATPGSTATPGSGSGSGSKATRARGANRSACEACRNRKIRCSGEKPACLRCAKLDKPCLYFPVSTTRRSSAVQHIQPYPQPGSQGQSGQVGYQSQAATSAHRQHPSQSGQQRSNQQRGVGGSERGTIITLPLRHNPLLAGLRQSGYSSTDFAGSPRGTGQANGGYKSTGMGLTGSGGGVGAQVNRREHGKEEDGPPGRSRTRTRSYTRSESRSVSRSDSRSRSRSRSGTGSESPSRTRSASPRRRTNGAERSKDRYANSPSPVPIPRPRSFGPLVSSERGHVNHVEGPIPPGPGTATGATATATTTTYPHTYKADSRSLWLPNLGTTSTSTTPASAAPPVARGGSGAPNGLSSTPLPYAAYRPKIFTPAWMRPEPQQVSEAQPHTQAVDQHGTSVPRARSKSVSRERSGSEGSESDASEQEVDGVNGTSAGKRSVAARYANMTNLSDRFARPLNRYQPYTDPLSARSDLLIGGVPLISPSTYLTPANRQVKVDKSLLPPKEEVMALLEHWEKEVAVQLPVLDGKEVKEWVERVCVKGKRESGDVICAVLLVLAVSAVSIHNQDSTIPDPKATATLLWEYAQNFFPSAFVKSPSRRQNILHLQIMLVRLLYVLHKPEAGDAWALSGAISRAAIDLGLHREGSSLGSRREGSEGEVDLGQKIFWTAYTFDREISVALGRPFAIPDDFEQLTLKVPQAPSSINGENGIRPSSTSQNQWDHLPRLRRIQSIIASQRNHPLTKSSASDPFWLAQVQLALRDWKQTRPTAAGTRREERLDMAYHQTVVLLYRPMLAESNPNKRYLEQALESSREVLRWYKGMHRAGKIEHPWLSMYHLFSAGLTYASAVWFILRDHAAETEATSVGQMAQMRVEAVLDLSGCTGVFAALTSIAPAPETRAMRNAWEAIAEYMLRRLADPTSRAGRGRLPASEDNHALEGEMKDSSIPGTDPTVAVASNADVPDNRMDIDQAPTSHEDADDVAPGVSGTGVKSPDYTELADQVQNGHQNALSSSSASDAAEIVERDLANGMTGRDEVGAEVEGGLGLGTDADKERRDGVAEGIEADEARESGGEEKTAGNPFKAFLTLSLGDLSVAEWERLIASIGE